MEFYVPWSWKEEHDPLGVPSPTSESSWLLDDVAQQVPLEHQLAELDKTIKTEPVSRGELAKKLLDDLDDWIKEEPFSDWYEQQVDLPIFEELPGDTQVPNNVREPEIPTSGKPVEIKSIPTLPNDTLALLQEFETVFGEVEMSHGALTPPESPTTSVVPTFPVEIIEKQQQQQQQNDNSSTEKGEDLLILTQLQPVMPITPVGSIAGDDLAREMAVVDELVRTRVEDLVPNTPMQVCVVDPWRETVSSSPSSSSSPESSDVESDSSNLSTAVINHVTPPSPASSSSSGYEESDPEWTPSNWKSPPASPQPSKARRNNKPYGRSSDGGASNHSRRRSAIGVEEKRLRKKEQNKNAATRYRLKKKAEVEEILTEEKALQDTNSELQQKVSDLSREIKYLKGLMRDMLKAKGMLN